MVLNSYWQIYCEVLSTLPMDLCLHWCFVCVSDLHDSQMCAKWQFSLVQFPSLNCLQAGLLFFTFFLPPPQPWAGDGLKFTCICLLICPETFAIILDPKCPFLRNYLLPSCYILLCHIYKLKATQIGDPHLEFGANAGTIPCLLEDGCLKRGKTKCRWPEST